MILKALKFLPYLAAAGALASAFTVGYTNGRKAATLQCAQERQVEISKAIEQQQKILAKNSEIANTLFEDTKKADDQVKVIEKEVIRYVERTSTDDCVLDDDGVRIINELIKAANS